MHSDLRAISRLSWYKLSFMRDELLNLLKNISGEQSLVKFDAEFRRRWFAVFLSNMHSIIHDLVVRVSTPNCGFYIHLIDNARTRIRLFLWKHDNLSAISNSLCLDLFKTTVAEHTTILCQSIKTWLATKPCISL